MPDAHMCLRLRRLIWSGKRAGATRGQFDLPYAVAAVAAVLLQNPGLPLGQTERQLFAKLLGGGIQVRVTSPTHAPRPEEHFLGAHLLDHVGMCAHEDSLVRDLP